MNHSRILGLLFCMLCISLSLCLLTGAEPPNLVHGTGDRDPTPEETAEFLRYASEVVRVRPTPLALERLNNERHGRGLGPLTALDIGAAESDSDAAVLTDDQEVDDVHNPDQQHMEAVKGRPTWVDNSREIWFPPIRSQGRLNSCSAWAVTYYQYTYEICRLMGWNASTGNNDIIRAPTWTYNFVNHGLNTTSDPYRNYYVIRDHGAITWNQQGSSTDERSWCMNSNAWRDALQWRYKSLHVVTGMDTASGIENLKQLLANGHVAIFSTHVRDWSSRTIGDNPQSTLDDPFVGQRAAYVVRGSQNSGHIMTFVGYNDDIWIDVNSNGQIDPGELGAFKVANSWGTGDWNGGYRWVAYDAMYSTTQVSGWTDPDDRTPACRRRQVKYTIAQRHQPTLYGRFTLRHRYRNEAYPRVAVSSAGAHSPDTYATAQALHYSGGAYAFDGSNTTHDATFVYDFSSLNVSPGSQRLFWLAAADSTRTSEALNIKKFELLTPQGEVIAATGYDPTDGVVSAATGYAWVDATMSMANQFPSSVVTAPSEGALVPMAEPVTIVADAADTDGSIVKVEFWNDTTKLGEVTSAPWQLTTSFATTGTKVFYAIAFDNHGASTRSPARHITVTQGPTLDTVTVTADPAIAGQPGSDFGDGAFLLTRTLTSGSLTVSYEISGTATPGVDYTPLPGSTTFADGQDSISIPVVAWPDDEVAVDGTVVLTLSAETGYQIGSPSSATVTIRDAEWVDLPRRIVIDCGLPEVKWMITPEADGTEDEQGRTVFDGLDGAIEHILEPTAAPTGES